MNISMIAVCVFLMNFWTKIHLYIKKSKIYNTTQQAFSSKCIYDSPINLLNLWEN